MTQLARRIFGVETEYGVTCASTTGGEPPLDADGAARLLFEPIIARARTSNHYTAGGGRLYLDVGSHPEYATAECDRLEDLLAQDRAGELHVSELAERANARLEAEGVPGRIHLLKNNHDALGHGFGCHENYLVRRRGDFWNDARTLVPHLVSRQILVGAGDLIEYEGQVSYVFSQRARDMEDAVSSATTRARPLINTRDEPHADAEHYRRMHVIVGDSNIAQGSTLLKVAAMDLLLSYLEEGGDLSDLALAQPMQAIRDISLDLTGRTLLERLDGGSMTALELQTEHLARVSQHAQGLDLSPLHREALSLWERGLAAVEQQRPQDVATELDWAAKWQLISRYLERSGAELNDPRIWRLNLAYHDLSPTQGLGRKLEASGMLRRLIPGDAARGAMGTAPASTRAHLRGAVIAEAQRQRLDLSVDWVTLKLDDGRSRAIALKDPFATEDARITELLNEMRAAENSGCEPLPA